MTMWSQDEFDKLTRWVQADELAEISGWIAGTERLHSLNLGPRLRLADWFRQWVARAPASLRILVWLTPSLPSIIHSVITFALVPLAWLVNIVTGHRYNRIWGLRIVRVARGPILLIGVPWLLSFFSSTVGWVMLGWLLVYLVLRQFNGVAVYEEIVYKRQWMAEEIARRAGISVVEAREMVTLLLRATADTSDANMA